MSITATSMDENVHAASSSRGEAGTAVKLWLYTVAALIAVLVLVGGATRLTDSGLSITEWAPFSGILPPLSHEQWVSEFARYQQTDEFKLQNYAMTLAQFEVIYWWEWGHRFLGRLIGLSVLIPMVWFWLRGTMPAGYGRSTFILFLLICFQGAIGWWMVQSGLSQRVDVSQLRLAIHLTMACIIFVYTVWLARGLGTHTQDGLPIQAWQGFAVIVLVLSQTFLGGLVAGLDAGMAYNTWPTMNGEWMPAAVWAITPWWQNLFDNAVMVQFVHRTSAYLVVLGIALHAWHLWANAPDSLHARRGLVLVGLVFVQMMIGIVTLVMQVPFFWALVHQFGAIVILAFAAAHWRALSMNRTPLVVARSA